MLILLSGLNQENAQGDNSPSCRLRHVPPLSSPEIAREIRKIAREILKMSQAIAMTHVYVLYIVKMYADDMPARLRAPRSKDAPCYVGFAE